MERHLHPTNRFSNEVIYTEIDVKRLLSERRKNTTFQTEKERTLIRIPFEIHVEETELTRRFASRPFVPSVMAERNLRCEEILTIQAMGLKNVWHMHMPKVQSLVFRECLILRRTVGVSKSI